jgi:hypothetical protein
MTYRDRVQVYKDESASEGGSGADAEPFPTGINVNQDALEAAGLVINDWNGGVPIRDASTTVERVGNDMVFKDGNNPVPVTLSQLLSAIGFAPTAVGQTVYSHDGVSFRAELPLTELDEGWLMNNDGTLLVVG